jgi:hypothetical protein
LLRTSTKRWKDREQTGPGTGRGTVRALVHAEPEEVKNSMACINHSAAGLYDKQSSDGTAKGPGGPGKVVRRFMQPDESLSEYRPSVQKRVLASVRTARTHHIFRARKRFGSMDLPSVSSPGHSANVYGRSTYCPDHSRAVLVYESVCAQLSRPTRMGLIRPGAGNAKSVSCNRICKGHGTARANRDGSPCGSIH